METEKIVESNKPLPLLIVKKRTKPCEDYKALMPYDLTDHWNSFIKELVNKEDTINL